MSAVDFFFLSGEESLLYIAASCMMLGTEYLEQGYLCQKVSLFLTVYIIYHCPYKKPLKLLQGSAKCSTQRLLR